MADQPDTEVKLPDPVLAAATMAKVAERSQALMKEFLARQSADGKDAPTDPLNIGTAFIEMTTRLMRDPAKLVEAQMALWRSYVDLTRKNQRTTSWPAPISAIVPYQRGSRLMRSAFWCVSDCCAMSSVMLLPDPAPMLPSARS